MADVCAACHEPLLVEVEPDSDVEESKDPATAESVLDDLEFNCRCHFHWECFLEADTITQCPSCSKNISSLSSSHQQQVLCIVRNEGGVQTDFDILPVATEEAYLRTYPEERRGHAFLEFCREGDVDAIIHLVRDEDEDEEIRQQEGDVLRYQGTFEGIEGSGLHVAIKYQREEVAWLLLALASSLDWAKFPPVVLQAMESLGVSQNDRKAMPDIRSLKDGEGRMPVDLAKHVGNPWSSWISDGRLNS